MIDSGIDRLWNFVIIFITQKQSGSINTDCIFEISIQSILKKKEQNNKKLDVDPRKDDDADPRSHHIRACWDLLECLWIEW